MFNKVILLGHLAKNIELRYVGDTPLGNTSIATNRKSKGRDGTQYEEACFIDITFWGRSAEIANQYLRKGSKILIEGRLKFDTWQDNNGQNRSKHSVVVETMNMLDSRENSSQHIKSHKNQNYQNQNYQNQNHQNQNIDYDESELAF